MLDTVGGGHSGGWRSPRIAGRDGVLAGGLESLRVLYRFSLGFGACTMRQTNLVINETREPCNVQYSTYGMITTSHVFM